MGSPTTSQPNESKLAEELDWVTVRKVYDEEDDFSGLARFKKKFNENPLVPIGCLVTAGILTAGIINMTGGNRRRSQLLMRGRVVAQTLTVICLAAGICKTSFAASK